MADITLAEMMEYWANLGKSETLQDSATATGNGTALDTDGHGGGLLVVSGTFEATVIPEGSIDGTTYYTIPVCNIDDGVTQRSITEPGRYQVDCRGLSNIRARVSDYTSGSVTVKARVEPFSSMETAEKNVQVTGSNMVYGVEPVYLGLVKMGTLKYDDTEQPLPIRPWRDTVEYSIIHNDAGTSTGVSFGDGTNVISISGDLFDVTLMKVGDNIIVDGSNSNDGTYEIESFKSDEITVDSHTFTDESAGETVTISMLGDIVDRQGTLYTFGDTSETAENVLQWHALYDIINGKPSIIYVCDRNLISDISYNHINDLGWIFGDDVTIDGATYLCRSLTGGAADRDGDGSGSSYAGGLLPNEWDRYIMNGVDQDGPFFSGAPEPESDDYQDGDQRGDNSARRRAHNQAWHWLEMYSWCQETVIDDASRRARRGSRSARYWTRGTASHTGTRIALRPALVKEIGGV